MLSKLAIPRRPAGAGAQSTLVVLLALVVIFAVAAPGFFTTSNGSTMIRQGASLAIVTFGVTLCIATSGLDLSVGSIMALSAVVAGLGLVSGWGLLLSLVAALAAAIACGVVNGSLIAVAGMPPFVATLGMMGVARGLALVMSDGKAISGIDPAFIAFLGGNVLGVPVVLLFVLLSLAASHFLLSHTPWGLSLLAMGGNRVGARLAGLSLRRDEVLVYGYSGLLAGVAGLITISRMNVAHPLAGQGYEFDAIAAAVIGGAALEGGRGSAVGALLGAVFVTVLRSGLAVMGVSLHIQLLAIGLVIAFAFALDHLSARNRAVEEPA
ncbi:MAG: ABC transporter permease [Chloroflexi bacterium]|nr:ABC transporter permease [Chloroflexota bacterium]